jgi:hypothetical protein
MYTWLASIKAVGGLAVTSAYVSDLVAGISIPLSFSRRRSAGGSASWMNSAGRDSIVPNSAEKMALSSLVAVLRPRRTQG